MNARQDDGFTLTEMMVALLILSLTTLGVISITRVYGRAVERIQTDSALLSLRNPIEGALAQYSGALACESEGSPLSCEEHRIAGACHTAWGAPESCTAELRKTEAVWRLAINAPGLNTSLDLPRQGMLTEARFSCQHTSNATLIALVIDLKGRASQSWLMTSANK